MSKLHIKSILQRYDKFSENIYRGQGTVCASIVNGTRMMSVQAGGAMRDMVMDVPGNGNFENTTEMRTASNFNKLAVSTVAVGFMAIQGDVISSDFKYNPFHTSSSSKGQQLNQAAQTFTNSEYIKNRGLSVKMGTNTVKNKITGRTRQISTISVNNGKKLLDNAHSYLSKTKFKSASELMRLQSGKIKIARGTSLKNLTPADIDKEIKFLQSAIKFGKVDAKQARKSIEQLMLTKDAKTIISAGKDISEKAISKRPLGTLKFALQRTGMDLVVGTYAHQGYGKLRNDLRIAKISTKLGIGFLRFGPLMLIRKSNGLLTKGFGKFGFKKAGMIAGVIGKGLDMTDKGLSTGSDLISGKLRITNKVMRATGRVTKGTMHIGVKVVKKSAKATGKVALKTGKKVAKKVLSKGQQKVVKKTLKTISRVGGKIIKPFRFLGRVTGRFGSLLKQGFGKFLNLFGTIKKVLFKYIAIPLLIVFLVYLIIVSFFSVLSAQTAIGDAIQKTYNDFKTKTTMGATYEKLLQKDKKFAAAVSSLVNNTNDIPANDNGIKQWTNYNIHFIGPDGREISGFNNFLPGVYIGTEGSGAIINATSDGLWTLCKKAGWNDYAAAAFMGNVYNECSMNHKIRDDRAGTSDIGMIQWTGSRKNQFLNWCSANGYDWTDLETQFKYLYAEPCGSGFVQFTKKNYTDVNAPTDWFIDKVERYQNYQTDIRERNERRGAAKKYYEYYVNNNNFSDIEEDEDFSKTLAVGNNAETGSTTAPSMSQGYGASNIKGILSMAYIYIDEDFKKYGSITDYLFGDSVYKDYCAKLYDASHIIAKSKNEPVIYYCPAYSAESQTDAPHIATEFCNNHIPQGFDDEGHSGDDLNRPHSASFRQETREWETEHERSDGNSETVRHSEIVFIPTATGPLGSRQFSASGNDSRRQMRKDIEAARKEMIALGSKETRLVLSDIGEDYVAYDLVDCSPVCKGHMDNEAWVFISNIYDPQEGTSSIQNNENTKSDGESENESLETPENSLFSIKTFGSTDEQIQKKQEKYFKNYIENIYLQNGLTSKQRQNRIAKWERNVKSYLTYHKLSKDEIDVFINSVKDLSFRTENISIDDYVDAPTINDPVEDKGWHQSNGKWYYISNNRKRYSGGIFSINGILYGFDEDGNMLTGWQVITDENGNPHKYYFKASGEIAKGWEQIGGYYYFFEDGQGDKKTGELYENEQTPDGYKVGANGVWENPDETKPNTNNLPKTGKRKGTVQNANDNTLNKDIAHTYDEKSYDRISKQNSETRFSLYAIDKYATAFDEYIPKKELKLFYKVSGKMLPDEVAESMYSIDTNVFEWREVVMPPVGRPGDDSWVQEANENSGSNSRAGEMYIMTSLTGQNNIEIVDWWKNEGWLKKMTNAYTKTYYRIYDGDKNIDQLNHNKDAKDTNVVNELNGKAFWFNAWSKPEQRNNRFAKEGWNADNVARVRLLMAGDWTELYGIKSFGGFFGSKADLLTPEEIQAILANEPGLSDLPKETQNIIATAYLFNEKMKLYRTPYVFGGGHTSPININQIGPSNTFDCSSYVSNIYYNAGLVSKVFSTSELATSKQFVTVPKSEIRPGDMLVQGGHHVVLYLGNGKASHAAHTGTFLADTFGVPANGWLSSENFIVRRPVLANN